jgi:2-polyprenyl-3-methyl-5-hydroxy-6-metoxy-1,4-benzoquinol methylase
MRSGDGHRRSCAQSNFSSNHIVRPFDSTWPHHRAGCRFRAVADASEGANTEFVWASADPQHNHTYLAPALLRTLGPANGRRLLDLGSGNGALTALIAQAGFQTVGAEASSTGLAAAKAAFPDIEFLAQDISDPLPSTQRGIFDVVVAAEVIEHLFLPRQLFARASEALTPSGTLVLSTPFHGYWKNLALALANKFDHHFTVAFDYGHIKFFSIPTLTALAKECGYDVVGVDRIGRIPAVAKTMVAEFRRSL